MDLASAFAGTFSSSRSSSAQPCDVTSLSPSVFAAITARLSGSGSTRCSDLVGMLEEVLRLPGKSTRSQRFEKVGKKRILSGILHAQPSKSRYPENAELADWP